MKILSKKVVALLVAGTLAVGSFVVSAATANQSMSLKTYDASNVPDPKPEPKPVAVNSVKLSEKKVRLAKGQKMTLTATVKPANATDKKVAWSSSNSKVVSVKNGKITAKKAGSATITATAGGKSDTCKVTVVKKAVKATTVKLNKSKLTLKKGKTAKLKATIKPNAKKRTYQNVKWSSSKSKVASVDQSGKVTAKKTGTATITVKVGKKKATCKVTVKAPKKAKKAKKK